MKQHSWELTLAAIIAGLITLLTAVTHLTAHPERSDSPGAVPLSPKTLYGPSTFHPVPDPLPVTTTTTRLQPWPPRKATPANRAPRHPPKPADPLEVTLGPSTISGRFKLLTLSRTPVTPTTDKLTLELRVTSRAMAPLVTPFQSAMLEVRSHAMEPISPEHPFSYPVSAGNTRDEDIAFMIPSALDLDHAVLRIYSYPELKEIPLRLAPRDSQH